MATLDYSPKQKMRVPITKIAAAIVIALVLTWLILADYAVDTFYVCQECGMTVRERRWYGFASLTTRSYTESAASEALAAHGVKTSHRWAFFSEHELSLFGRGYGCATGDVSAVLGNSHSFAGLLDNLYTYSDPQTADLWRRRLLDLSTAKKASATWYATSPDIQDGWFDKFGTKKDFDAWWEKAGPEMERLFTATK